ncbi:MAG: C39 family peptidase [Butyrivibrio sp.]|nr:C39 family peptidase [Acetatifactor muris]MCM1560606.1 C39 family peptidase [Butyrivibrio sp.]
MQYKGKKSKRDRCRNRKSVFLGLCVLSCFLLIICGVEIFRLRAALRDRDRLFGRSGEIAVTDSGGVETAGIPDISRTTGMTGGRAEETVPDKSRKTGEEDYPASCGLDSVDPPKKRSRREVLKRLEKLGEDSALIAGILQNRSDYPDKLLEALANNPEMADFVSRWQGLQKEAQGGLTDSEKGQDFPLFLQWDPRWGYVEYGEESCIGLAGCGPTCLSMALYYLTGDESITPDRVSEYSMENGCYIAGTGTAWVLLEILPLEYGISVRQPAASESEMKAALDEGGVIILSMGPGDFTAAGHFIVVYGYDGSGFMVNDPNCVARSRVQWSYSEIEKQIKHMWVFSQSAGEGHTKYYEIIKKE